MTGRSGELFVASHAAAAEIKAGRPNDMKERLKAEPLLAAVSDQIDDLLEPHLHVGRAPEQVVEFVEGEVAAALAPHADRLGARGDVRSGGKETTMPLLDRIVVAPNCVNGADDIRGLEEVVEAGR